MIQSTHEIKIRQLLYQKAPSTSIPSQRSAAVTKLQTLDHKLGKTKYTTQQTLSETRPFFENFMTKSEATLQNGFKLPFIVEEHENQRAQIHFLEVFTHSSGLVQNYINDCTRTLAQLKEQSSQLKIEMQQMKEKREYELESIEKQYKQIVHRKERQLKEDFVKYSTESFRLNKEISKLNKEKMQLEMDSMDALSKIVRLEKQLQGVDMGLVCENEDQLQTQFRGTFMNTKNIIH